MTQAVMVNGVKVQPDDPESMFAGWKTVEKLASKMIWDYVNVNGLRNGYTFDDLMQEIYLLYDRVIKIYDYDTNDSFVAFLIYSTREYLKTLYDTNDKNRTLEECISIDKAHYDDDGSKVKEAEFIPGGDAREEAEDALQASELKSAMDSIIGKLSSDDRQALQAIKKGEKVPSATKTKALRAARLAILSADEETKEIVRAYAPYI